VIPFLGWVLGAVLIWLSRLWTTRDKLVGTVGGLSWVLGGLGTARAHPGRGPVRAAGGRRLYLGVRLRAGTAAVPAIRLPS
jgi:hypothetical protein